MKGPNPWIFRDDFQLKQGPDMEPGTARIHDNNITDNENQCY